MRYLLMLVVLAGCGDVQKGESKWGDCWIAEGATEALGTPDNLGPCIGVIENKTVGYGGQTVILFRHTLTADPMVAHWMGDDLIGLSG